MSSLPAVTLAVGSYTRISDDKAEKAKGVGQQAADKRH